MRAASSPAVEVTKKRRGQCPIPAKLLPHLRRAKARGGDMGYVINRDGRRLANVKKGFENACRRAGLEDTDTARAQAHGYLLATASGRQRL